MPGGKRRALKKLLRSQQQAELPPPPSEGSALDYITFDDEDGAETTETTETGTSTSTNTEATSAVSGSPDTPGTTSASASASDAPQVGQGKKKSSRQRFAERQARKQQAVLDSAPPSDPAWNETLERERQEEIAVISDACGVLGREIFEIQPDGHCMFSAVADQLGIMGLLPPDQSNNPYHTRRVAAQFMRDHRDDFLPFLASVDGEDMPGATDDGIMTPAQFEEYCHRVESTAEWGGEPEIQALCRAFGIPIHVIQRGPPTVVSHGGEADAFGGAMTPKDSAAAGDRIVRISYHRRMYGLGEHYNSLRPAA